MFFFFAVVGFILSSFQIMMDRGTGRSRGFGFVTFKASESAKRVLDEKGQLELDGRQV